MKDRAGSLLGEHTIGFLLAGWSLAMGRMLIGMGLMKMGVFSASGPADFTSGWSRSVTASACR